MAVAGLAVAVPLTLVLRGGSDEGTSGPGFQGLTVDRELGVRYRLPEGWSEREAKGVINLRSTDRQTGVTVTDVGPSSAASRALAETLKVIRKNAEASRVISRFHGETIGGLSAAGAIVSAVDRSGNRLEVVVATAPGRKKAYLVEAFTHDLHGGDPLTGPLLGTLELTG
jgi:hypothetical protein